MESIVEKLREAAEAKLERFQELVREAYDDLALSIRAENTWLPPFDEVFREVEEYLPAIQIEKVNSEKDVKQLLDREGQLELRNRLNIFIGGQILDRGLTIANLIGFYYGRRANRFQQDTVLQHARMYGARPCADLAVTRFYTSPEIYQVLHTIHEFDAGLRAAFLKGGNEAGIVFIRQEGPRIVPCSPNKVLLSTLTTLRPGKRLLPVGFQTGFKTHIGKTVAELDTLIARLANSKSPDSPVLVSLSDAEKIVELIAATFEEAEDSAFKWNVNAFKASMEYVSRQSSIPAQKEYVFLLIRRDRDNVRIREGGRFFDAPDTSHVEGLIASRTAQTSPMLMIFRQNGRKEQGWRDTPFWWPVLYMPQRMGTVVFASDVNDFDADSTNP